MNKINFSYFNEEEIETIIEKSKIKTIDYATTISFNYLNNYYNFDYLGIKIMKNVNTNKLIRSLLNDEEIESNISINNYHIKNKDIIIISPFTKINDILSSKTNGNLHNFLKDEKIIDSNSIIEKTITNEFNKFKMIDQLTDINLSKVDLINFIDINDNFVSEKNIKLILDILKNTTSKKLIIFNDVEYIKISELDQYISYFNFLYVVNEYEENYKNLIDYKYFLILVKNNLMYDHFSKK
jgi:hypothetical protein